MRIMYFFYLFLLGIVGCGTREPAKDNTPQDLVGVWDLMNDKNQCLERYVFNADGTFTFYDIDGQSNGAYNLKDSKKLGLFHVGRKASYLPFDIVGDGRLVVFKAAQNNYYVRVPSDYEVRVKCPSGEVIPPYPPTVPNEKPCDKNKCPPVCPPCNQDKTCPPCPPPAPPAPPPPPPAPTPPPAPRKCSCTCECTVGNVMETINVPYREEYEFFCWPPKPVPPPPAPPAPPPPPVPPCPPERPCPPPPPPPRPLPQSCKCTCNAECN